MRNTSLLCCFLVLGAASAQTGCGEFQICSIDEKCCPVKGSSYGDCTKNDQPCAAQADNRFSAPTLDVNAIEAQDGDKTYLPVVFMHGLGDSGSNAGMQSLAKSVTKAHPGTYSIAVDVADGMSSFFNLISDQVDAFAKVIQADAKLKDGFNAVGLSQGNLVVRGYIERYNNPPVKSYVSICAPHEGEGGCPAGAMSLVCPLWKLGPYTAHLAFAGYWKDVTDKAKYLKESTFMADINNERDTKNATYKANMLKLDKYVLVEALNDTVIIPKESSVHGFWKWGDKNTLVAMEESDGYQGDWIGLKTLDGQKKIDKLSFVGDHIRFSNDFWNDKLLPYLN